MRALRSTPILAAFCILGLAPALHAQDAPADPPGAEKPDAQPAAADAEAKPDSAPKDEEKPKPTEDSPVILKKQETVDDGGDEPIAVVPSADSKPFKTKGGMKKPPTLHSEKRQNPNATEDDFLDLDDIQWTISPEYRVRTLSINPLELSGTTVQDVHWTEQRFRLDTTVAKVGVGAIRFQADFLDGVLFGDNGDFGGTPGSNSGVTLTSNRPNVTKFGIGLLKPDGDPLDREAYGPVLVESDIWEINYLYADVYLPFGIIRVGRQPKKYGAGIPSHDGGPYNRWGVSKNSDAADRVLFGTKLDEAFYTLLYGYQHVADPSLDNGVIGAVFYDWQTQDNIYLVDDNLTSLGGTIEVRKKKADWLGWEWKNLLASIAMVNLTNEQFDSNVWGFPMSLGGQLGDLKLITNYMHINGQTREVAEGFAVLSGTDAQVQDIVGHGLQFIADYNLGPFMFTFEFDYASGDDDPRVTTPLTQFQFARDMNVGLLLFEHIMQFESARSAAVGIENLIGLDAESFPITEVSSEGRFNNAIAIFPQIYTDLFKNETHNFFSRVGALMAWSAASGGVVDPILTSLGEDGNEIADDAVNFHGGKPARYYGTEVDLQLGYKYKHYFHWTVEGAILFPGAAIQDENGDAVKSYMVENRFEFRY